MELDIFIFILLFTLRESFHDYMGDNVTFEFLSVRNLQMMSRNDGLVRI